MLLGRIDRQLGIYLAQRPAVIRLDTAGADVFESYDHMLEILTGR